MLEKTKNIWKYVKMLGKHLNMLGKSKITDSERQGTLKSGFQVVPCHALKRAPR